MITQFWCYLLILFMQFLIDLITFGKFLLSIYLHFLNKSQFSEPGMPIKRSGCASWFCYCWFQKLYRQGNGENFVVRILNSIFSEFWRNFIKHFPLCSFRLEGSGKPWVGGWDRLASFVLLPWSLYKRTLESSSLITRKPKY